MEDLIEIIQVIVLVTLIALAYSAAYADVVRKIFFRIKMRKKASKSQVDIEFEDIYNTAISTINMKELKKEHAKNFSKKLLKISLVIIPLILMFSFPYFVYELPELAIPILIISPIMMIIGAVRPKIPEQSTYINEFIKNLILTLNSSIKIHKDARTFFLIFNSSKFNFKEEARKTYDVYGGIEYQYNSDSNIKLAKLLSKTSNRGHIITTTEGIMIQIQKNKNYNNEILIEMNKFFKKNNRVKPAIKDEFEKYFDVYSLDVKNTELIINSDVRNELARLYEEYGIMFEILLKDTNIYIRILTGELFKFKPMRTSVIDKKRFHRDYIIIKNIMRITEKINTLF